MMSRLFFASSPDGVMPDLASLKSAGAPWLRGEPSLIAVSGESLGFGRGPSLQGVRVRLLEPGTAESGDAHDPRTTAAPPEASQHRRFSTWPDLASLQPGEEPGFDPAAARIRAAPQHHTSAARRDDSGRV